MPTTSNIERRTLNSERKPVVSQPRVYDLEPRLLEFSAVIIDVSEKLPATRAGSHIAGQLLRAGTSPYGNHGEAQTPESMDDFIHKMKICLKELRETRRWLRLSSRAFFKNKPGRIEPLIDESVELIRIFAASIKTAARKQAARRRNPGEPSQ